MTSIEAFGMIRNGLDEALQIARGEAEPFRTHAPVNDGEGPAPHANPAKGSLPSPSPKATSGHRIHAEMAKHGLPDVAPQAEAGHAKSAARAEFLLPASALIDQLAELQVRRKFWIKLANRQSNAALALIRRAIGWRYDEEEDAREKVNKRAASIFAAAQKGVAQKPENEAIYRAVSADLAVIVQSMEPGEKARNEVELEMRRAARRLHVYPWVQSINGLGELGLAVIVGEAGDLSGYPKKGHLWKRLGLAPFEGRAMSTWRMKGGLSADQWTEAGYSPGRRAEIFAVIGDPLFRAQSARTDKNTGEVTKEAGIYRQVYDRRRAATAITHAEWAAEKGGKAHSHADGLRVMTKTLLRDLWSEWNRREGQTSHAKAATGALPHDGTDFGGSDD